MNKIFTCIFLLFLLQYSFAQEAVVKGKITDARSNEALPGAILSLDKTPAAASDGNGNYKFKISSGIHTLTFKMLGYKIFSKEIEVKNSDSIVLNVKLEDESTALNTVVISAGRYEQKLSDVTISMEVIHPELVENKNTTTLDNILDQVPGVAVVDGQTSIRGGSGYSYGAGSRVLLLVDDLPMLTADAGDVKWSFLPTENLQQIEVIKGASSTLYGSSALNGVINVRTAFPADTALTKVNTSYSVYDNPRRMELKWWGNSVQSFEGANFMHSQKFGNFDLVLGGLYFHDDGYRQFETVDRYRFNFNTRYRFQSIKGLSVGLNGNIMQENGGLFLLWQNADSGGYKQSGNVQLYKDARSNLDPYAVWYAPNGDRYSLHTRYFNSTNTNNTDQGSIANFYYAEFQFEKKFRKNFTLVAGAVADYSVVRAMDLYGDHTGHNVAGYVQAEKKIQRLTLVAGVRAENYKVDTSSTKQTILGIPAKPVFRAGMNYQLLPYTFLRASFGQGYRFPSIAEKFISTTVGGGLNVYPNPDLQPETGWSSEIGIKQGFKIGDWNGYIDIAGFDMEYQNMMEFTFGYYNLDTIKHPSLLQAIHSAGFESQNIGDTRIDGVDITVGGTGKIAGVSTTLMAGYTYTDPVYLGYNPAKDTTGTSKTNILKYRYYNSFKGDVQFDFHGWSFGTSVRYTGFMVNIDKKFVEPLYSEVAPTWQVYILPGLAQYREEHDKGDLVFDSRLSYRITKNFRLGLIVNNVFNRETMPRPGSIGPPRTTGLQISWKF